MSKISLKPNNSGSGNFSIESPGSNSDQTFTLPDSSGTVLTDTGLASELNATGSAPLYACRAWVNFDGTGTVSIRESGNVSSITDNGTANYTVNFATAMPDGNYVANVTTSPDSGAYNNGQASAFSASSFAVRNSPDRSDSFYDSSRMCVSVFR